MADFAALEAAYGGPSQAAFGSAVFHEPLPPDADLEAAAQSKYRYFVGDLWQRWGEAAWLGAWKQVYQRPDGSARDIVAELRGITDPGATISVPMILDTLEGAESARAALAGAFDDTAMADVRVFTIGDGAAMSGLLVAGARSDSEAVFLVFLLD